MKEEKFNVLDYREFDRLVTEHLKPKMAEFESVAEFEWSNDSSLVFEVTPDNYFDFDRESIQKFLDSDSPSPWMTGPWELLAELASRGVIPWGNYLVEVSW